MGLVSLSNILFFYIVRKEVKVVKKEDFEELKRLLERILWKYSLGALGIQIKEYIDKIDEHLRRYYKEVEKNE